MMISLHGRSWVMQNKASRIDRAYNRISGSHGLALVAVLWVLVLLSLVAACVSRILDYVERSFAFAATDRRVVV